MTCYSNSYSEISKDCNTCNEYCNSCKQISNSTSNCFSAIYSNLENNYPMNKCLCHDFGTNPRYYNPIHVPCNCKDKCIPCY